MADRKNSRADPPILVRNPQKLQTSTIDCERVPVGEKGDYKPCVAVLPNGELLLTMFHMNERAEGKVLEQNLLFRSGDGGRTWSDPQKLVLLGREPYFTVLRDGTVFMTGHLLANDVRNTLGYIHGYVHLSNDAGKTWETTRIDAGDTGSSDRPRFTRNVLELADGTLLMGADCMRGKPCYMWRSTDRGRTWDRTRTCDPIGFQSRFAFFGGEAWLWQARSGKIIGFIRVESSEYPIKRFGEIVSHSDADDHEMIWESVDNGKTFRCARDFGEYGQMYPSVLRLRDGRLLYTFTVRSQNPPLGVQALIGIEHDDGFTFDFESDRLILDSKTPTDKSQGGGFGPTVQLGDGTLVTSYSYRGADDDTHAEVVRWTLPEI